MALKSMDEMVRRGLSLKNDQNVVHSVTFPKIKFLISCTMLEDLQMVTVERVIIKVVTQFTLFKFCIILVFIILYYTRVRHVSNVNSHRQVYMKKPLLFDQKRSSNSLIYNGHSQVYVLFSREMSRLFPGRDWVGGECRLWS